MCFPKEGSPLTDNEKNLLITLFGMGDKPIFNKVDHPHLIKALQVLGPRKLVRVWGVGNNPLRLEAQLTEKGTELAEQLFSKLKEHPNG